VGTAATLVLCAIGLTAVVSVDTDFRFQRPNWQLVARALGPWPAPGQGPMDGRIVVVQDNPGIMPLGLYLRDLHYISQATLPQVTEIDVIAALPHHHLGGFCWWGSECNLVPSRLRRRYAIPGFHLVGRSRVRDFGILRLRSARPRAVTISELPAPRPNEGRHFIRSGRPKLRDAMLIEQA
ncbi:MAG TPA: hypothetical protein VFN36_02125, partial [Solirubrobacteraceae bacterium]|nr:hypothetical protein [Solirubrobacteraceae bacterium]